AMRSRRSAQDPGHWPRHVPSWRWALAEAGDRPQPLSRVAARLLGGGSCPFGGGRAGARRNLAPVLRGQAHEGRLVPSRIGRNPFPRQRRIAPISDLAIRGRTLRGARARFLVRLRRRAIEPIGWASAYRDRERPAG